MVCDGLVLTRVPQRAGAPPPPLARNGPDKTRPFKYYAAILLCLEKAL